MSTNPAMLLRAGQFELSFPRPALVMGVVNVTPDSFSDGGKYLDPAAAVDHAMRLAGEGAGIIDIGGESTRPNAEPVPEAEELRRVMPVIERLTGLLKIPISIDTMKPAVARAALGAGASIVNDVAANRGDDEMWRVVAKARAGYVCMHTRGTPQTMQDAPAGGDVLSEAGEFFFERIRRLNDCGVTGEQLILDPGIGFGKTPGQNVELLGRLGSFRKFGRPLLLGVSRKSFLGKLLAAELPARLPGALACACMAVEAGAQIIRAHDVAENLSAIRMTEAILAERERQ